jgi:hypothetical protein
MGILFLSCLTSLHHIITASHLTQHISPKSTTYYSNYHHIHSSSDQSLTKYIYYSPILTNTNTNTNTNTMADSWQGRAFFPRIFVYICAIVNILGIAALLILIVAEFIILVNNYQSYVARYGYHYGMSPLRLLV